MPSRLLVGTIMVLTACVGRTSLVDAEGDGTPGDGGDPGSAFSLPLTMSAEGGLDANGVAVTPSGAVLIGGTSYNPWTGTQYQGTLQVGGLTFPGREAEFEAVFSKWAPTGAHEWAYPVGSVDNLGEARRIVAQSDGSSVACAFFVDVTTIQGVQFDAGLRQSPVLLVFDSSGSSLRDYRLFPSVTSNAQCNDISLAGSFIAMAGVHTNGGSVDLGAGNIPAATADPNAFVALYDAGTLSFKWQQVFISASPLLGPATAATSDGGAYFTVVSNGPLNMGNGSIVSLGSRDIALARYGPTGGHIFSRFIGGPGNDDPRAAVARPTDNGVVLCGSSSATFTADTKVVTNAGGLDAVVLDVSPSGTVRWARSIGGAGDETCFDIAIDSAGNVYVAGSFENSVDFGGQVANAAEGGSGFVASFDALGSLRWAKTTGGVSTVRRIALHEPSQSIWIYGTFSDSVVLDGITTSGPTSSAFVYRWPLAGN